MTTAVTNVAGWKIGNIGKLLIAPGVMISSDYGYTQASTDC